MKCLTFNDMSYSFMYHEMVNGERSSANKMENHLNVGGRAIHCVIIAKYMFNVIYLIHQISTDNDDIVIKGRFHTKPAVHIDIVRDDDDTGSRFRSTRHIHGLQFQGAPDIYGAVSIDTQIQSAGSHGLVAIELIPSRTGNGRE